MKIAQALLLRKQLEEKVKQLTPVKQLGEQGMFELKTQRAKITDEVDEIRFQLPKITLADVTAEYDKYATALRKIDAAIQKANWEFDVTFTESENPFNKGTEEVKKKK